MNIKALLKKLKREINDFIDVQWEFNEKHENLERESYRLFDEWVMF